MNGYIVCCKGLPEKQHHAAAGVIVYLNKGYTLEIVQAHIPTSYQSDETEMLHENMKVAMKKHRTQFSLVIGKLERQSWSQL